MAIAPGGAVLWVARRRVARRGRDLATAAILLGVVFGICLASVAAARTTASAYERILLAADAPDAAISHGSPLEETVRSLGTVAGIVDQRVYAGFLGDATGIEPGLMTGVLAPTDDSFPLELPVLRAGRLPDAAAPDEVFVNDTLAERAGLEIGQRLSLRLRSRDGAESAETTATVVGIGTIPFEAVSDETLALGVVVSSRAFYDTHRELTAYSVSNVDLEPGFDAQQDLAGAVEPLGHAVQSARAQEQGAVDEAVRPIVILFVALGLLAFVVAAIGVVQFLRRDWDHDNAERTILRTIGMTPSRVRLVDIATSMALAGLTIPTAIVVMLLASPLAPVGPLHDLDPARGFSIDVSTAAVGGAAILLTVVVAATVKTSPRPRPAEGSVSTQSSRLIGMVRGATALAGSALALRTHGRGWRPHVATILVTVVLALCVAFVPSVVNLTETSSSYGFDADLVAINAYGDQPTTELRHEFGRADEVLAATGYTFAPFLVDGRAVPGVAATAIKGDLAPTVLRGRTARADDEIVIGADTLASIGATVGDVVPVRISNASGDVADVAREARGLRIVGVATFPPVNQIGTDTPRLGTGALVTDGAFRAVGGQPANEPEFTIVRLADGTDPAAVTARIPNGFQDDLRTTTTWRDDVRPAEIRQLSAVLPYLWGALVATAVALVAVFIHALRTRTGDRRHDLAALRALGCTRSQLDRIVAWQVLPIVLTATIIGIPVGIALGRWSFALLARSLAVVETPSTPVAVLGALGAVVVAIAATADLVNVSLMRRTLHR